MAIQQRKPTNILVTFKVFQFVNQLRRGVKPRAFDGPTNLCQLGTDISGLRALKSISKGSRIGRPNARRLHHTKRVCRRRKNNAKTLKPWLKLRTPGSDVSASPHVSGGEVQHILRTVDNLSSAGHGLSSIANDDKLFLTHSNLPIFGGYSLNQLVQLKVMVQEAIDAFSGCRSQYGDDRLIAQGLDFELVVDEVFIANYEHLLLRLRAELAEAQARKTLEELLHRGHDKRQRKLLAWFSEFAEKPQPLSTSFPWTIKPSLAVLWGVCWMFYDHDSSDHEAKGGNNRVRQDVLLQNLAFPSVPWNAPASSDYVNFGLQLIGQEPRHAAQQPSRDNVTAGLDEMFQARNTETCESDLSPLDFRLPSRGVAEAMGSMRFGQAAPQLPDQNTYYHPVHEQFSIVSPHNNYLPQNPGSPLTAFPAHLGSLNSPWEQQPYASLPLQRSPRHLGANSQTPSIRVTGTAGSESAPPQFVAFGGIYHQPQTSPLQLNTTFDFPTFPYAMGSQISPDTASIQVPQMPVKHERTSSINSNSNMPTPVSMSGPRSPLLSPTSGERARIVKSPQTHSRHISEDRSSQEGDEDGSLRKNHGYKRAEEPPRNQEGKMVCRYHECASLVFDRKCEWSKHMDKHDRPYKCNVRGCEKLQGFTYSGGLLRHEREVHKLHGGTKKSLFCPFHDCKRSSGAGFTRKENLTEHIRRVHRRTSMSADMHGLVIRRDTMEGSPIAESQSRPASESPYTRAVEYREDDDLSSSKRKRGSDSGLSDRGTEDLRAEIKRLRQENEEKDSRLHQLEQAVMALQHQTRR